MHIVLCNSRTVSPTLIGAPVTLDNGLTENATTFPVRRIRLWQQEDKNTVSAFGGLFLGIRYGLTKYSPPTRLIIGGWVAMRRRTKEKLVGNCRTGSFCMLPLKVPCPTTRPVSFSSSP